MPLMFAALWAYRQFILSSVMREFQSRYRASLLGAFWTIAQPLTLIVIYTVIFGQLMQSRLSGHEETEYAFSIYVCAGVIFWTLFAEMLTRMSTVFIQHADLMKKTAFPRICLPAIVTGTAFINFAIIFSLYMVFLFVIGHFPTGKFLFVFPLLAIQVLLALGLGLLLGTMNVFFRDVAQFTGILLQFWFWLTPIVYAAEIVPVEFRGWLALNPMQPVVIGYQNIFLERMVPDLGSLLVPALVALGFLSLGSWIFWRRSAELVDEL